MAIIWAIYRSCRVRAASIIAWMQAKLPITSSSRKTKSTTPVGRAGSGVSASRVSTSVTAGKSTCENTVASSTHQRTSARNATQGTPGWK